MPNPIAIGMIAGGLCMVFDVRIAGVVFIIAGLVTLIK